jgi:rSAM/selenodomain-associated transferase 2
VPDLSVVIPTLNESARLPRILADLRALPVSYEVVVADGGSEDGTREVAREAGAGVVESPPGRGRQLRRGVAAAGAPWLLVLHADVRASPAALAEAAAFVRRDDPGRFAAWPLAIDAAGAWLRLVERVAAARWRIFGLPYGDQGLVLHRSRYDRAGGYPEAPIMEDVALVRGLRRVARQTRFREPLVADARRYLREGRVRRAATNAALITLFAAGVSPARLAQWYRPEPAPR